MLMTGFDCQKNKCLGWLLFCLVCGMPLFAGCREGQVMRPNDYFEAAEDAYRAGQYTVAHGNYVAFLKQNPDPQLSRLAERRILAIEREIECVWGQNSVSRPAYVYQDESVGTAPSQRPRVLYKSERPVRMPNYE